MTKKQKISYGRKFDQVIAGATEIFLRDGYAAASVDDIAQAATVSKATLYSYFPDKKLMFEEALSIALQKLSSTSPVEIPSHMDAHDGVHEIARQIAVWLVEPQNVRLYRVHVAETVRFSTIANGFQTVLQGLLHDRVRGYLDHWVQAGQLDIPDTSMAADLLIRMAGASIHDTALLSKRSSTTEDDVNRIAEAASRVFLRAYAPSLGSGGRLAAAR
ncbi:TetR/AcrR family transcriptional regulator [Paracoccus caeni]|uniref:TetR/AcrR family transcriptional regulator n=1 Tax=Paracoccus caeni TaxID=657651 RepID=A0A934SF54_9RHOB|nr:TetR/AcrR family transcriptional regulator [Paracoccus caeni]MBK4216533.1 TetR/AcrR family transcriptional regulator [Paracoccus caeni]